MTCPRCTSANVIGREVQFVYDGVLYWDCGDCGKSWHRWPEGTRQREIARAFVADYPSATPAKATTDSQGAASGGGGGGEP